MVSWSLIAELNAFFSEVWFSFPCFLLICSVSSGLVIPPPVSFGPNALVPSSPTEQGEAEGNVFLHTVCGHVFVHWFSQSLQPFQSLLKLCLKNKVELRTVKGSMEICIFDSVVWDSLSAIGIFCIAIIIKLVLVSLHLKDRKCLYSIQISAVNYLL